MILFLLYSMGNITGGELYFRRIHEYLKEKYDLVRPENIPMMPPELSNPFMHARKSLAEVKECKPRIAIIDLYSGCRNTFAVKWLKKNGSNIVTLVSGLREKYRHNSKISKYIAKKCEKYVLSNSDIIIAISDYIGEYVGKYAGDKTKIIVAKPGIKIEIINSNENLRDSLFLKDRVELLTVGAFNIVKGTKHIVEAIKYLQDLNIRLNIVGPYDKQDSYYLEVIDIIEKNSLRDKIEIYGFLDKQDLSRLFSDCDIYALPSLFEGYGIVIAEAISFGLPIVATRVGAVPELIENNVNGILVDPKDSEGLARGIRKLINDDKLRAKMRKNNFEKSKKLPTWRTFENTLERELVPELDKYLD